MIYQKKSKAMKLWLSIFIEASASGFFSVIIYSLIRLVNLELGIDIKQTPWYRWLFFTGYYKHTLSFLLGFNDYLSTQWSKAFSKKAVEIFYTSVGSSLTKSPLGKWAIQIYEESKKLNALQVTFLESFLEAFSFILMGMSIYRITGIKGTLNIFATGVLLYIVIDTIGLHFLYRLL